MLRVCEMHTPAGWLVTAAVVGRSQRSERRQCDTCQCGAHTGLQHLHPQHEASDQIVPNRHYFYAIEPEEYCYQPCGAWQREKMQLRRVKGRAVGQLPLPFNSRQRLYLHRIVFPENQLSFRQFRLIRVFLGRTARCRAKSVSVAYSLPLPGS